MPKGDIAVIARHHQQKPFLLLTDAKWLAAISQKLFGQPVFEPAMRAGNDIDILLGETDLFPQFAIQGFFWAFIVADATLRKLPCILTDTTRPQHLPHRIGQDDAYIGAKTFFVDHGTPLVFS